MNPGSQYTVFLKDGFLFGVPIEHVREVIHKAVLIPAPVQAAGFLGFFDFRQKLCPVFDVRALVDQVPGMQDGSTRNLIVVECENTVFALWIDKYVESLALGDDAVEPTAPGRPFVDQVFRYKGKGLSRLNLSFLRTHIQDHVGELLPPPSAGGASSAAEADPERELLCFSIEKLQFGIPIVDLVEVIAGYSVEPLFQTNHFLRGLINLRGQIIACVDLSEVIGVPKRKMEERNQYLLLQDNERDLALCIDAITKKRRFKSSQIQPAASLLSEELSDYLLGVIEEGAQRTFVLSGPKIIASKYLEPYQELA